MSRDKGATWKTLFRRGDTPYLWNVATHPTDPDTLYVCAFTQRVRHTGGGIWKSTDAGETWFRVLANKSVASVTVDPNHPDHLFACVFWDGLFQSTDAGRTWNRIDSFPFRNPFRVVFPPGHGYTLYVCCFGSSVWRGTRVPVSGSRKTIPPSESEAEK